MNGGGGIGQLVVAGAGSPYDSSGANANADANLGGPPLTKRESHHSVMSAGGGGGAESLAPPPPGTGSGAQAQGQQQQQQNLYTPEFNMAMVR